MLDHASGLCSSSERGQHWSGWRSIGSTASKMLVGISHCVGLLHVCAGMFTWDDAEVEFPMN